MSQREIGMAEYLKKHDLQQQLTLAIKAAHAAQSPDPQAFIAKYLTNNKPAIVKPAIVKPAKIIDYRKCVTTCRCINQCSCGY